ncbi:ComEC/Rec2 family competence protein [Paenibacillus physcomitrellae]|uniref:MBL fold protein n=1 Tax=Paenibacillus physcomitrellae TaxID=1619311 RepID=A0ABQ1FLV4_9BACL|nr:ComEC/Rec2 family competence protein [Paenibacillus physcomitrellae]GGA21353.1 MBL fold protein [Paenibacillus physcomitrellae]
MNLLTKRFQRLAGKGLLIFSLIAALCGCSLEPGLLNETAAPPPQGESLLRVIFLDVGQGASQLLIAPSGKTMLIDAGNNDNEQTMLDYLHKYGIKRLDTVIGTHPDADHIGGMDKVIDETEVGNIYLPKASSNTKTFESLLKSIQRKGLKVKTAKAGVQLDLGEGIKIKMLAPVKSYEDSNNMSAVVKVTYGKNSFLLTGDAESQSEKDMLASGADLCADVLLVGHHGSKSSTTLAFLKAVKPRYGIIQVGKDNNYGHPTQTVLQRLKKQGVEVYRNDLQGTIEVDSDGTKLTIQTER